MNNTQYGYTLEKFRREVFKALDEYSCNGNGHEVFSGGTGDIEKRFVSALNSAVRLVYLACARRPVRVRIQLASPDAVIKNASFTLYRGQVKEISATCDTALSFAFCGSGRLEFVYGENILLSYDLKTGFGEMQNVRKNIPENTDSIRIIADNYTIVKNFCLYGEKYRGCDEKYLPDGKSIYCAFSPRCTEICSVIRHCGGRDEVCPTDIFTHENGILCCDEKYSGEYTVEFYEYPDEFCENDPPEKAIQLSPAACSAAVYAAAAELCAREDGELYSRLMYKYRELLANIYPATLMQRKNSFFAGGRFGRRRLFKDFRG